MHEIRQVRMDDGEVLYVLADKESGAQDLFVLRHILADVRSKGSSSNTIKNKPRGIRCGLALIERENIDIEERISTGQYLHSEELLRLADLSLRRQDGKGRINGVTGHGNYMAFIEYVKSRTSEVLHFTKGRSNQRLISAALTRFEKRAAAHAPRATTGAPLNERLGLDPVARELFLRVIQPGDPGNPFQKSHQVRNYALLLVAYTYGLRSGEEGSLKTYDYVTRAGPANITIHRRPDDPDEKRLDPPLTKTLGRMLPVGEVLRQALDAWVTERQDRRKYPLARKNPYLFVSRKGQPLTLRRVRQLFEQLRSAHPELGQICQHVLRHDANDRWTERDEETNADPTQSRNERTYVFGWCITSKQPDKYSKAAIRRAAAARMQKLQEQAVGEPSKE